MHQPYDQVIPFLTQEKWNIYPYKGLHMNVHSSLFCVHAKSLQSCLTLWDFIDCSLPDSSVHGTSQARILECKFAVLSSRGSSWSRDWTHASCVFSIANGFFTPELPEKPVSHCTESQFEMDYKLKYEGETNRNSNFLRLLPWHMLFSSVLFNVQIF